ncbi:6-phosphogluconolactonase [Thiobacillus sp.]|uniref:6-phosphogluconolactonase n=1 Tax=Thiobacillus sp. TaxID=924 RepID=UPI0025F96B9C|nr:6-phosphogluconolactonase [Thiobacillus sp.]MBT9539743.1 6-phosphogluconolactonase [Thiobacillus sp.]
MSLPAWHVFADANALVAELSAALCAEAASAIAARGDFHLVLAGGTTPLALYRALASQQVGDARWHVWYGDERCLPVDHPERNSGAIEAAWLAASAIPPENRRPIPAELGSRAAAESYGAWLAGVADFDLVLLGMGEDGHTASLFPGHDWNGADVLAVHDAPKPPPERVSLSVARLNRSQQVWFVVTGAGKREALSCWKNGASLPVSAIHGKQQTAAWIDRAAWSTDT